MHLIVCVDERDGMCFAGKRLSSDIKLVQFLLEYTQGSSLWMNRYSAKLFEGADIVVEEDLLGKTPDGAYCLLENTPFSQISNLESVMLCQWNRRYPSTEKFPRVLLSGMQLESSCDFPGNSHEKITVERYTR